MPLIASGDVASVYLLGPKRDRRRAGEIFNRRHDDLVNSGKYYGG